MALKKEIELENGITTNYHRIVSINKITNNCNIIEVASYTSEKQREKENSKCSVFAFISHMPYASISRTCAYPAQKTGYAR